IQIDRIRALRGQVGVKEREVADLIIGIVVNVDVHVLIKVFELLSIYWVSAAARYLFVLNTCEFVVLHPEIGLHDFGSRREPEQSRVSPVKSATSWLLILGKEG